MGKGLYVLLAVTVGMASFLQAALNTVLLRLSSLSFMLIVVNGVALFLSLIIYLFTRNDTGIPAGIPWYAWLSGVVGIGIVAGVAFLSGKFGFSWTFTIVVAAQLIAALVADHLGLWQKVPLPISLNRSVALLLIIMAVWLSSKEL